MPSMISSSTSLPASITAFACLPSSVPDGDRRPQHVAGGKLDHAMAFFQPDGLGSLSPRPAARTE